MSKFDLEAAKRGEVVQVRSLGGWVDAHFVGVDITGKLAVIEYKNIFVYPVSGCDEIRMKPKQREMWCFPYKDDIAGTIRISRLFDIKESAEDAPAYHLKRAGEIQMILVDEE